MADKASIIKEAQKYLAKGQVDKAIAEWEKLVVSHPDGNNFNFIGDLYLKKGDKTKAVDNYHKASSYFKNEGFSLKALALYKKILNINSSDPSALYALGQLNEEKNITTDAIKYYLAAFDIFSKENKKNQLLEVYGRIIKLAPTNIPLRLKLAELFSKHGYVGEASNEYRQSALLYEKDGDTEKCREYLMKSVELQPSNKETLLSLIDFSEKQGDVASALKYLKSAFERTGESKELLMKNAQLLAETGSLEDAIKSALKAVEKDPSSIDSRRILGDIYQRKGDAGNAWEEYLKVVDGLEAEDKLDEAIEVLESFKLSGPADCRKRLVVLLRKADRNDFAFNELVDLCQIYEETGDKEDALSCLKEALEFQPDDALLTARVAELESLIKGAGAPAPEERVEIPPPISAETGTPSGEGEAFSEERIRTVDEAITEADIFFRYGLYPDARRLLEELKARVPSNIDVHLKLKALYSAVNENENVVTECIILSELYGREGDAERKRAFLMEAREIDPEDPRLAGKIEDAGIARPEEAPSVETEEAFDEMLASQPSLDDFSEEFTQAEFYFKEGLYKESEDIIKRLIAVFPDNSDLKTMMAEVKNAMAAEKAPTEELKPSLVESQEPPIDSDVLDIFEEFKRGLEKEVSTEDSETHYNLGIAYKEMDLVDDAIKEFQVARKDHKYFVDSTNMLGICYMQKNIYPLAIDSFQSALMKIKPGEETSWGIKYELAGAYEKSGNLKEALRLYTEVYGWDSKFRETAEKIESIKKMAEFQPKERPKKSRVSYI